MVVDVDDVGVDVEVEVDVEVDVDVLVDVEVDVDVDVLVGEVDVVVVDPPGSEVVVVDVEVVVGAVEVDVEVDVDVDGEVEGGVVGGVVVVEVDVLDVGGDSPWNRIGTNTWSTAPAVVPNAMTQISPAACCAAVGGHG